MPEQLVYVCSPRPFEVPPKGKPHREKFGRLEVIEYRSRSKQHPYGLRMQADVSTVEEAEACHAEALHLADDLNVVWAYVAGMPLFPIRVVLAVQESPDGWKTNFGKLHAALPTTQRIRVDQVRIVPGKFSMRLPYMPLKRALTATRSYRAAGEKARVLIGLHFDSMKRLGTDAGLFVLAKALELARVMLPGNTDKSRQRGLPAQVVAEFRRDLHWLYFIANDRLEIRHVIGKKALLPRLEQSERRDFMHDADLVIRAVVEGELGIEAAIIKQR